MNEKPHLHELEICTGSGSSRNGVRIRYGDTSSHVSAVFGRQPSARRVNRRALKVLKRHDKGSVKIQGYTAVADKVNSQIKKEYASWKEADGSTYTSRYPTLSAPEVWATDVLKASADVLKASTDILATWQPEGVLPEAAVPPTTVSIKNLTIS